jgi:hypothetical protein
MGGIGRNPPRIAWMPPASASGTARTRDGWWYRSLFQGGTVLFKKLFRMLVVGGAVAGVQVGCATGSSAKSSDGSAAAREGTTGSADGGTATAETPKESSSSAGGGVMGW